MFPSNLLLLKYNLCIFSSFPNHGTLPFIIFSLKCNKVRPLRFPIGGGMFPCILFCDDNIDKLVENIPMACGKAPLNLLWCNHNLFK